MQVPRKLFPLNLVTVCQLPKGNFHIPRVLVPQAPRPREGSLGPPPCICWFLVSSPREMCPCCVLSHPLSQQSYPAGHGVHQGTGPRSGCSPSHHHSRSPASGVQQAPELLSEGGLGNRRRCCTINLCNPSQPECKAVTQNKRKSGERPRVSITSWAAYLFGRTGRGWQVSSHLSAPTGVLLLRLACRHLRHSQVAD